MAKPLDIMLNDLHHIALRIERSLNNRFLLRNDCTDHIIQYHLFKQTYINCLHQIDGPYIKNTTTSPNGQFVGKPIRDIEIVEAIKKSSRFCDSENSESHRLI